MHTNMQETETHFSKHSCCALQQMHHKTEFIAISDLWAELKQRGNYTVASF